jgi:hypothetical protein
LSYAVTDHLFLLFVGSLIPGLSAPIPQSSPFHDADTDLQTKELLFDPFISVDWEHLARLEHMELNPFDPTPAEFEKLKQHYAEHANLEAAGGDELKVSSQIPPSMKSGFFYGVSTHGLVPLQLLRWNITVVYTLNESRTAISKREFYGQVVASAPGVTSEDIGFVYHSDTSAPPGAVMEGKFSAQKVDQRDVYHYEAGGRIWNLSVKDEGLFDVVTASPFSVGQTIYLFVKWKPDTVNNYGGCERQFSLFVLDQEFKLLASNRSGCDV